MIVEILQWIAISVLALFLLGCVLAVMVIPEEPCTECYIYKERINKIIDESEERNIQDGKMEGR